MLKVKDIKEILNNANDEDIICLKFSGTYKEIERGDCFEIDKRDIDLRKNEVTIWF